MWNLYQVNDIVEIQTGEFAGYEGRVVATPKLTNFYTYTVDVNGYEVGGLREKHIGLAIEESEFLPPAA